MNGTLNNRTSARQRRLRQGVLQLQRLCLMVTLVVALLVLPVACTTSITGPIQVSEPVHVVLLDHGRHSSLVLPMGEGRMVRYAYGDWDWYARMKQGPMQALNALCVPSQGTLGRRVMDGPVTLENVRQQVLVGSEQQWLIAVEQSRVRALQQELEELYQQHAHTLLVNQEYDLEFVHHPRRYTYFHNSNHVTAGWLRRLGCESRGPAFQSKWRVVTPDVEPPVRP